MKPLVPVPVGMSHMVPWRCDDRGEKDLPTLDDDLGHVRQVRENVRLTSINVGEGGNQSEWVSICAPVRCEMCFCVPLRLFALFYSVRGLMMCVVRSKKCLLRKKKEKKKKKHEAGYAPRYSVLALPGEFSPFCSRAGWWWWLWRRGKKNRVAVHACYLRPTFCCWMQSYEPHVRAAVLDT